MRLVYATSISYPSSLANRIQILAMAKEFSKILPGAFWLGGKDIKGLDPAIYGEAKSFHVSKSPVLAWKYLSFMKKVGATDAYCREHKLLFFMMLYDALFFRTGARYFYEAHDIPEKGKGLFIRALKKCDGIVSITKGLGKAVRDLVGKDVAVLHAPDGIDLSFFDGSRGASGADTLDVRRKLGVPLDARLVMYTGHLYAWKGVFTLAEAMKELGDLAICAFVGGTEKDVAAFRALYGNEANIKIAGSVPHAEVPSYIRAADVLALPNSGTETISRLYTSPLKMFEYMASGKPIVASGLPSIREVLDEKNSVLFTPDDPKSLASAIRKAFQDPASSAMLAERALHDVRAYSWDERARRIRDFIQTNGKR